MIIACLCGGIGELALIAAAGTCAAKVIHRCRAKQDPKDPDGTTETETEQEVGDRAVAET